MSEEGEFEWWKIVIIVIIVSFVGCCCCRIPYNFERAKHKVVEFEVEQNIIEIKKGLDQYASEHDGIYPPDVDTMIQAGYLEIELRRNIMTKKQPVQIEFGTEPFMGEYTYLPVKIDDEYRAYYLFGYGSKYHTALMDIDKDGENDFVKILVSGPDDPEIIKRLPPIEELLK